ncbi:pilus assembly protein PilO [Sporosarcina sp. FSL K6-1522]|uniref:pilus assembly protein PilO n=1 Tax=Sporosarcina sp. FSL K6-1522 TaxID=2921554 RepID=UPI00315A3404
MTKWMNSGNGIYLVQAMRVKSKAELKVEMDALELQIQEAERYWAERKGLTA